MADTTSLGSWSAVKTALVSAASGFAFGEAALIAFQSPLIEEEEDGPLLTAAVRGATRVGSTGVAAVAACLAFSSALLSLGTGFHVAAAVIRLSTRRPWLAGAAAGPSIAVGAVVPGILGAAVPAWVCAAAHCAVVVAVYSSLDVNEMTVALSIIFTGLYLGVAYGRCGPFAGACLMGVTVAFCCALRRALTERRKHTPGNHNNNNNNNNNRSSYRMFDRMMLYSVAVAVLGFLIGLGTPAHGETPAEVARTLDAVVRVGVLAAGLVGSALGTVAVVGLQGPDGAAAGRVVAAGTAVTSWAAMRLLLPALKQGAQGRVGVALGAAAAAGVSLGSAGVAAKEQLRSRSAYLVFLALVVGGVILATRVLLASKHAPLPPAELITVCLVAVGAFILGAPNSPFHMAVNMRGGRVAGPDLFRGIAVETVSGAAAPLGAGVLGAAALGMAALGRLGTLGVLLAGSLAVGRTLMGGPSTTSEHRD